MEKENTQLDEKKARILTRVMEAFDDERITKNEFETLAEQIMDLVVMINKRSEENMQAMMDAIEGGMIRMEGMTAEEKAKFKKEIQEKMESMMNGMHFEHDAMMAECDAKMTAMEDKISEMDAKHEEKEAEMMKKVKEMIPTIPELEPETAESIKEKLVNEPLPIEAVAGLKDELETLRKDVTQKASIGGTGASREFFKAYDLSASLDGTTKTFNIPAVYRIVSVVVSSFPFILRPTTDYTWTPTSITFTDEITAAGTLAEGQTCIIHYVEA